MSRFLVFDTALTQSEIASVISGTAPSAKPGAVQAHLVQTSVVSGGANPTVPYAISWAQGTCPAGATSETDPDCSPTCGDGVVQGANGETCDVAIATGKPGACPASCSDGLA